MRGAPRGWKDANKPTPDHIRDLAVANSLAARHNWLVEQDGVPAEIARLRAEVEAYQSKGTKVAVELI